jgi:hypothetical protein
LGQRHKVTGKWRRLHNGEFNGLYSSSNTIQVIKSRRMRWDGHVACLEERKAAYRVLVGKPEGKRPPGRAKHRWEDSFKWIFKKWNGGTWTGLTWPRKGTGGRL